MSETQDQDGFDEVKKAGWILKKSKYRKKWKRTWLILESSNLAYGKSEEVSCSVMVANCVKTNLLRCINVKL